MNVIVVGAGLVGFQVANRLLIEGKNVTIIDQDEAAIRYASSRLDCMVIQGPGNNIDTLRRAGAEEADYFIALTGSDEINMICCALVESEFNIPNKLARVRNEHYLETQIAEQHYWGIDYLINPTTEAVKNIVQQIDAGAQNYVMLFENIDIQIQRFVIQKSFPFVNKNISALSETLPSSFIVPVIHRKSDVIIPDGSTTILEGDEVFIAAKEKDFPQIYAQFKEKSTRPKKILIVGAGSIGMLVLHHLFGQNGQETGFFKRFKHRLRRKNLRSVLVVERDYVKCRQISEQFPEALVIHADISEENVFEEENLSECDLLITATENTEFNIITSLYARTVGIESTITLVRSDNQSRIAEDLGLNIALSLKNTVVNSILRYLLRVNITSIHSQGLIDFLEFTLESTSPMMGRAVRDIPLPLESIILYVKRGNQTIIPSGDFVINEEDHLLILARSEHVQRIEGIIHPEV